MFRCYISGGMQNRSIDQVRAERKYAVDKLLKNGIFPIDPAASEQKLWKPGTKSKIPNTYSYAVMKAFVKQDLILIRKSDALLVLTGDDPSDGTWWEMAMARWMIRIPVIMIAPQRYAKKKVGWSNILIADNGHGDIVPNLDAAIRLLKRKYVTEYNKHRQFFEKEVVNAKHPVGFKRKRRRTKLV